VAKGSLYHSHVCVGKSAAGVESVVMKDVIERQDDIMTDTVQQQPVVHQSPNDIIIIGQ